MGLLLAGCSAGHYQKSADKEAYRLIAEKTPRVPNMDPRFTIETNAPIPLDGLPLITNTDLSLGQSAQAEEGARILSLPKALEVAVKNGRDYQNHKEILYLSALDLSLARHRFTPIFSSGGQTGIGQQPGAPKQWSSSGNAGMDVLLRSGARIVTDLNETFSRFLLVGPQALLTSSLSGSLTQPLLRGAGYKVNIENLTQAERNLLYALREFVRYRQRYAVDIARSYYTVLRSRDGLRTAWLSFQAFKRSAELQRALQREGRGKLADLLRLQQQEISAETTWLTAINSYKQNLDSFKILIGLPTDARVVLDDQELMKLKIIDPAITQSEAVRVGLASRLDLLTTQDQYADAARKIYVAKNALLPDLNLILQASADNEPGRGLPDLRNPQWNASVGVNLPLDRKLERNSYRGAQIRYEQSIRTLELQVDNIKLDVYNGLRNLELADRNYAASEIGVQIGERRVAEQNLLAELGRSITENLISAQNEYADAKNRLTQALVDHNIDRLSLWRDLGILRINENGMWEEISNVSDK